ncbi:MAG: 50S ribosomal protein L35 [Patescibacteria group bacterium]
MSNKQKTRKSVAKRFKISGTGKVIRRVSFGRHIRASKSAVQKRRYRKSAVLTGRVARRVRRLLAIA